MEYKCGSCREVSVLSPKSKFCPICGSSSLILVVKELTEPMQKETVGVYDTATMKSLANEAESLIDENIEASAEKEEEDRPRRSR
jgi:hypothetical protein